MRYQTEIRKDVENPKQMYSPTRFASYCHQIRWGSVARRLSLAEIHFLVSKILLFYQNWFYKELFEYKRPLIIIVTDPGFLWLETLLLHDFRTKYVH